MYISLSLYLSIHISAIIIYLYIYIYVSISISISPYPNIIYTDGISSSARRLAYESDLLRAARLTTESFFSLVVCAAFSVPSCAARAGDGRVGDVCRSGARPMAH